MERNEDINIESGNGAVIDEMNKESISSGKKVNDNNNYDNDTERDNEDPPTHQSE